MTFLCGWFHVLVCPGSHQGDPAWLTFFVPARSIRDEIKSPGKISILSQCKIAGGRGPSEGQSLRYPSNRGEEIRV